MSDLFKDILPSILYTKKDILDNEKEYVPHIINKYLSYYPDSLFEANQMNINWKLSNRLQYEYLLNSLRAYKRPFVYIKWAKPKDDQGNLEAVKMFYKFSTTKAREAMKVLTDEQITFIKEITNIGE